MRMPIVVDPRSTVNKRILRSLQLWIPKEDPPLLQAASVIPCDCSIAGSNLACILLFGPLI